MSSNNLKALTTAASKVAALEARRAERQDEQDRLGAEVAADDAEIAARDARGEPVTALAAERERRLQRQRDLAAVFPLLEQQLAEARAELHAVRLQLGNAQLTTDEAAWIADGRAYTEDFHRTVLEPFGARASSLLGRVQTLAQQEQEVSQLTGRRVRGWTVRDRVIRETGLLMQQLIVLREWAAGRPIQLDEPPPQPQPAPALGSATARLARVT